MNRLLRFCLSAALFLCASSSLADTFGGVANPFDIGFPKLKLFQKGSQ
jgi:hypothetical protein